MAALALYDGEAEISAANIKALLDATNNEVASYWPGMWASALEGDKIEALLFNISSGGGGGGGDAPSADAAGGAVEAKKEEKPAEEAVDPMEGGMSMFGAEASDY